MSFGAFHEDSNIKGWLASKELQPSEQRRRAWRPLSSGIIDASL
jgi:hypothetical protein